MDLTFFQFVVLGAMVESLVQTLKPIWEPKERTMVYFVNLGTGLVVSIGVNLLAGLDLFAVLGVPLKIPVVGVLLTGILLSRGSNVVHDLWKLIQTAQERLASVSPMRRA